VVKGIYLWD